MKRSLLFALILLFIVTLVFLENNYLFAEDLETVNDNNAPKNEPLILKTGKLESSAGKINGTKGVTLLKGEIKITAESLTYYEEKKRADISDQVVLNHENGEISSNSMLAWLAENKYVFQEEVVMVQDLSTGSFSLNTPYLELLEEENSFQASQGVIIEYNGRTLKGEEVFYNEEEQTLELITNVYIEEDNGDWVSGDRALFYLETEEFTIEGGVELEIDLAAINYERGLSKSLI